MFFTIYQFSFLSNRLQYVILCQAGAWSISGRDYRCRGEAEVAIFSPSDAERQFLIVRHHTVCLC